MLLAAFAAAGFFLLAPAGRAGEWNQKLTITFSTPVQIPGQVLPAGSYIFERGVGNTSIDEELVRVYNKNHTHLYGIFLTIPDRRLARSNKPVLEFENVPPGSPAAIYAWFYPGDKTGHEFVYPKSQAFRLAQANNRPVASMPDELAGATSGANMNALKQARVRAETPSGKEVETVTVFGSSPSH